MPEIKKCIKSILYSWDYIFLRLFGKMVLKVKKINAVHFSIDDVFEMVQKPNENIIDSLSALHEKYKLIVHNYVLYKTSKGILIQLPDTLGSLTWMDWAPHQAEFALLGNAPKSSFVRLHEYRAEYEQINALGRISALLAADSNTRRSYGLSSESVKRLDQKGKIIENGVTYIKTDIRMEKMIFLQLLRKRNLNGLLIMFTHEYSYGTIEKRLYLLCKLMKELNIGFV